MHTLNFNITDDAHNEALKLKAECVRKDLCFTDSATHPLTDRVIYGLGLQRARELLKTMGGGKK